MRWRTALCTLRYRVGRREHYLEYRKLDAGLRAVIFTVGFLMGRLTICPSIYSLWSDFLSSTTVKHYQTLSRFSSKMTTQLNNGRVLNLTGINNMWWCINKVCVYWGSPPRMNLVVHGVSRHCDSRCWVDAFWPRPSEVVSLLRHVQGRTVLDGCCLGAVKASAMTTGGIDFYHPYWWSSNRHGLHRHSLKTRGFRPLYDTSKLSRLKAWPYTWARLPQVLLSPRASSIHDGPLGLAHLVDYAIYLPSVAKIALRKLFSITPLFPLFSSKPWGRKGGGWCIRAMRMGPKLDCRDPFTLRKAASNHALVGAMKASLLCFCHHQGSYSFSPLSLDGATFYLQWCIGLHS